MVDTDETNTPIPDMGMNLDPSMESRIDGRLHSKALRWRPADGFKGRKTINEVLDRPTVMTLYKMITEGIFSGVSGAVGAGKESLLFRGTRDGGSDLALKVYLVSTSNFKKRADYIRGDPRFSRFRRNNRDLVYLWAQKEFRNLRQSHEAGVRVPRPVKVANNVLAMEFVGAGAGRRRCCCTALPTETTTSGPWRLYERCTRRPTWCTADCSEYNIFKHGGDLVLFDLGSAVDRRHPGAGAFLRRDINNINRFFRRRGVVVVDPDEILGGMK